ncbi:cytochrome P450 [Kitasatospora sp. NPDC059599]|uniref:cytochrome P450 n=1 Tax=Kitasatospora sp. NPDC059599 TaxID=3346880 RepID=UPI00367C57F4
MAGRRGSCSRRPSLPDGGFPPCGRSLTHRRLTCGFAPGPAAASPTASPGVRSRGRRRPGAGPPPAVALRRGGHRAARRTTARGEAVLAPYAAAGRHPARYGDSGADFDVTRPAKDHPAFGHGPHFCLGAPLARVEGQTALRKLFDRFPGLAPAPHTEPRPVDSLTSDGHRTLPVLLGEPAPQG